MLIDGKELPRDANATTRLQFPPINDAGELKTYATIVKKPVAERVVPGPISPSVGTAENRLRSTTPREDPDDARPRLPPQLTRGDDGWLATPSKICK